MFKSRRRRKLLKLNDEIQGLISLDGSAIPTTLLKKLSDLDFLVRFGSTKRR